MPKIGDVRITAERYESRQCIECNKKAKHKLTFLLEGARGNPASRAYGKDDCSWCSDKDIYTCNAHKDVHLRNPPDGYTWCAEFQKSKRFAHMFGMWIRLLGDEAERAIAKETPCDAPEPA